MENSQCRHHHLGRRLSSCEDRFSLLSPDHLGTLSYPSVTARDGQSIGFDPYCYAGNSMFSQPVPMTASEIPSYVHHPCQAAPASDLEVSQHNRPFHNETSFLDSQCSDEVTSAQHENEAERNDFMPGRVKRKAATHQRKRAKLSLVSNLQYLVICNIITANTSTDINNISSKQGPFRCKWFECKSTCQFSSKTTLFRHLETQHLFPGSWECLNEDCDKKFDRKDNMEEHLRRVH